MSLTPNELFENLETTLQAITYRGTANKIFGNSARAVPDLPMQQLAQIGDVNCFVVDKGGVPHSEHPGNIITKFDLVILLENLGDEFGRYVLIGGNNREGLKDIENAIIWTFSNTETLDGNQIVLVSNGISRKQFVRNNTPISTCVMSFEAFTSIYQ